MKESAIPGPAFAAAACPVSTKIPAPIIAPIPRVVRLTADSVRFSVCSPVVPASAFSSAIDFLMNRFAIQASLQDVVQTGKGLANAEPGMDRLTLLRSSPHQA